MDREFSKACNRVIQNGVVTKEVADSGRNVVILQGVNALAQEGVCHRRSGSGPTIVSPYHGGVVSVVNVWD